MARMGTPMYAPHQRVRVWVTVETPGEPVRVRTFTGNSVKGIRRYARERYPDAVLSFGRAMWFTV